MVEMLKSLNYVGDNNRHNNGVVTFLPVTHLCSSESQKKSHSSLAQGRTNAEHHYNSFKKFN